MSKSIALIFLAGLLALPPAASAASVDASLVPDGTYTVKVEKVQDPQHMLVRMENGVETTLAAKGAADFSKVKANDTVRVSVISGKVPVYQIK